MKCRAQLQTGKAQVIAGNQILKKIIIIIKKLSVTSENEVTKHNTTSLALYSTKYKASAFSNFAGTLTHLAVLAVALLLSRCLLDSGRSNGRQNCGSSSNLKKIILNPTFFPLIHMRDFPALETARDALNRSSSTYIYIYIHIHTHT